MNGTNTDYSIIVCKICNSECKRYFAGRYPNGKDKRWIDANGREFSGKVCADCHAKRCAKRVAVKRNKARLDRRRRCLFVE
jgi:hypothetical protein